MTVTALSLIPDNITGKQTDVEHSITVDNREDAQEAFKRAYKRMLNINIWHKLSGFASAHFVLEDKNGIEEHRLAQLHDVFRIDIPGPGPASGDGYDWVQVEAIIDDTNSEGENESFGIRVRSCKNPHKPGGETAHFFSSEATSTLVIQRKDKTVISSYHGRNEKINNHTANVKDNIRNTVVGAGALAGISELQWSRLIKSFLEREV